MVASPLAMRIDAGERSCSGMTSDACDWKRMARVTVPELALSEELEEEEEEEEELRSAAISRLIEPEKAGLSLSDSADATEGRLSP